jgi:hypothetical protein
MRESAPGRFMAMTLTRYSNLLRDTGRLDKSEQRLTESVHVLTPIGDRIALEHALRGLALTRRAKGRDAEADALERRAGSEASRTGSPEHRA